MDGIKIEIAKTSLREMFKSRYFDICVVSSIIDMLWIHVNEETYNALRCLHCIHFGEMSETVKSFSYYWTLKLLSEWTAFDFTQLNILEWIISKPYLSE